VGIGARGGWAGCPRARTGGVSWAVRAALLVVLVNVTVSARAAEAQAIRPEEYVVSTFTEHDIVFLGEMHYVKQNLDFLIGLIPRLYEAGVYNLGYEFASYQEQVLIDHLITAPTYDRELAHTILLRWRDPRIGRIWGFQEYADVFRAAWELNHRLPRGARPFRIVALNWSADTDWPILAPKNAPADMDWPLISPKHSLAAGKQVLARRFQAGDLHWRKVIMEEFVLRGDKALIYCGSGHTATRFFDDRGPQYGNTTGNYIYRILGDRVMRLSLHGSESGGVTQAVEDLIRQLGLATSPFGLDLRGMEFGKISLSGRKGYLDGRSSGFTLEDITDGYVFLVPASQWQPVTLIPDIVTQQNRWLVQMSLREFRPGDPELSVDEINRLLAKKLRDDLARQTKTLR